MYYYAFTLRKTTPVPDTKSAQKAITRYYNYLRYFKKRHTKVNVSPTLETKPKLNGKHNVHLHAMIKSPTELTISDFPKERGLHIYLEPCQSKIAWKAYISKDATTEQDVYDLIDAYNSPPSEEIYIEIPQQKLF